MSTRALSAIGGELAKGLRDETLSKIMLDPAFLKIGSAKKRAEYMVEEWDSLGIKQEGRNRMIDFLSKNQYLDGSIMSGLPQYLDKKTLEYYQRIQKRREKKK